MPHSHEEHEHSHVPVIKNINAAFLIGIGLNLAYVIIQVIIGLKIKSLSLLSDAGHNFLDVASLVLAMLAFKLAKSKSTDTYTYGYKKSSILVALLNAAILLLSIGAIGYEATLRFGHHEPLPGFTIAIIAGIGILVNGVSAFLFFRNKEKDINVKAAFLHLASDALVSLGLVIGGIIIYYTHLYWVDSLLSIIICGVIVVSTWKLLRNSLRLSLDGVPDTINLQEVKEAVMKIDGVKDFHHLHIWAMSTTQNAMTAHLVVPKDYTLAQVAELKYQVKHTLEHLNIHHATLETETGGAEKQDCIDG